MLQRHLIDELAELVHSEHACGCDQNTCDVSVAYRLGYALWAVELFAGSGATSERFDSLYSKLGKGFQRRAEAERKLLCKEEHVECRHCNAVIWLPDEVDYYCDSCGNSVDSWERVRTIDRMINDRLTYKQFSASRTDSKGHAILKYAEVFQRVLKVSRKAEVQRLAKEGLEMIQRLESQKQEACQ